MTEHVTKTIKRKRERRARAHLRVRQNVRGSAERPRLSVYKSLKYVYAQVIDDDRGVTLAQANSADAEVRARLGGVAGSAGTAGGTKSAKGTDAAKLVGEVVAERAKEKGIDRVVFDRGGYVYHGKVKAVAQGARDKGLQF
jgi:large subunit ribosomal protein L18